MRWRLYYQKGTFSDEDGAPHESPPWGAVLVHQPDYDPPFMVNSDYLMWRTDLNRWTECGQDGLDDHLAHYGHLIGCVRKTRWIPTPDFRAIWQQARDDA